MYIKTISVSLGQYDMHTFSCHKALSVPILRKASNSNLKLSVETIQYVIFKGALVEKLPETITFSHRYHTLYISCHCGNKLELTLNAPITTKVIC